MGDGVNSVNAGFKVAELLSKTNPRLLIFSIGSGHLEGSTVCDSVEFIPVKLSMNSSNSEFVMMYIQEVNLTK